MRILAFLSLGACMSSEPVRDGTARITLDESNRGIAAYRVVDGSNDRACAHGEHFVPHSGANVQFGPSAGTLITLSESTTAGTYLATAPTIYATSYTFSIDGERFELAAPPDFTATIRPMSPSQAIVELTDASTTSDVVIQTPDGRRTARTLTGSPAVIDADFSRSGAYQIELSRTVTAAVGVVEIKRVTQLTLP